MHADYGNQSGGQMQSMVGGFAAAVAAFFQDLGSLGSRVTLATISEFGRRVAQNGNRGLDHGWGNMMLVMGGGVRGGQYYGQWPGLANGKLVSGDLQVTTDYRNVLGEIVQHAVPRPPPGPGLPGAHLPAVGTDGLSVRPCRKMRPLPPRPLAKTVRGEGGGMDTQRTAHDLARTSRERSVP